MSRPRRKQTYADDYFPSYRNKLPSPMRVLVMGPGGEVLDEYEESIYGFELTQEVIAAIFGKMAVHKDSYIEIRRSD